MKIRIQKYLSQKGILSRRKAEEYLKKGWLYLNGNSVTQLGTMIDPETDVVTLSDEAQHERQSFTTLIFYKPKGIVTNCKQDNEQEINDILPEEYRHLNAVGRLDKDSEGLILLTDDGTIANRFLNSGEIHTRLYDVWTAYPITNDQVEALSSGVDIGGYYTRPCDIVHTASRRIEISLTEGKNRQIRRMIRAVGNRIHRLKRVTFGPYQLGDLLPGEYKCV
jgi:pseudouridine synthase